jgi:hypothetical protein
MSWDEEVVQAGTRPSLFVRAVKEMGVEGVGARRVMVTGTFGAGRPVRVSRMWQVIGGRVAGAIVCDCVFLDVEVR